MERYDFKKLPSKKLIWVISSVIALCFIGGGVLIIKILVSDDGGKRRRQIQTVSLMKPPPPPKVKEKPPEPEIKKKEEVIEQQPEEPEPEEMDQGEDDTPPGEELGLDADGSAGGDAFGLRGKKGGRALIGGRFGRNSLLRQYAWYTQILQDEIRKKVKEILEQNGGIPEGNLKALVQIMLNEQGEIVDFAIYGSSGNPKMDSAVKEALALAKLNDPPPEGMPKKMKIQITSKG